jgi:hypothetical protein
MPSDHLSFANMVGNPQIYFGSANPLMPPYNAQRFSANSSAEKLNDVFSEGEEDDGTGPTGSSGNYAKGKASLSEIQEFTIFRSKKKSDNDSLGTGFQSTTASNAPSNGFTSTGSFGDRTAGNSSNPKASLPPPTSTVPQNNAAARGPYLFIWPLRVAFKESLRRMCPDCAEEYLNFFDDYLLAKKCLYLDECYEMLLRLSAKLPLAANALRTAKDAVIGPYREIWRKILKRHRRSDGEPTVSVTHLRVLFRAKIARWSTVEAVLAVYDGFMEANEITATMSSAQYEALLSAMENNCGASAAALLGACRSDVRSGKHPEHTSRIPPHNAMGNGSNRETSTAAAPDRSSTTNIVNGQPNATGTPSAVNGNNFFWKPAVRPENHLLVLAALRTEFEIQLHQKFEDRVDEFLNIFDQCMLGNGTTKYLSMRNFDLALFGACTMMPWEVVQIILSAKNLVLATQLPEWKNRIHDVRCKIGDGNTILIANLRAVLTGKLFDWENKQAILVVFDEFVKSFGIDGFLSAEKCAALQCTMKIKFGPAVGQQIAHSMSFVPDWKNPHFVKKMAQCNNAPSLPQVTGAPPPTAQSGSGDRPPGLWDDDDLDWGTI